MFRKPTIPALVVGALLLASLVAAGYYTVGDFDNDLDIDLMDFAALQVCFSGPAEAPGFAEPSLECIDNFDIDYDNDIDLDDARRTPCVTGGPLASAARGIRLCIPLRFHCQLVCRDPAGHEFGSVETIDTTATDVWQANDQCAERVRNPQPGDPAICSPPHRFERCSCGL